MANPVLDGMTRAQRRDLLSKEARRRKSGDWPAWETIELPSGIAGTKFGAALHEQGKLMPGSWTRQIRRMHRNYVFSVLERPLPSVAATHLAVSSMSGIRPTFHEMQRIKNEIAGRHALAVEIYPPHDELVDEADMFHLFVVNESDAAMQPFSEFTIFQGR